ncbi:MAG: neutral/alkaline non-lysosomal ceramidase N-terminal domain-containing protein [Phycisphaerae bacterium]|nr:neutral/alkaline non-lysosomal ceramidase N-terminal domain-containing protein [Phycisphaerae bacterium]
MADIFKAAAASADITPQGSQFLFGYPHVQRYSTGVHDPLLSTALYISDGATEAMFIANDIIFIGKAIARRVRERIAEATSIPAGNIMVTATHTHSGPITVDYISCEADPAVPAADPEYVRFMEDRIVEAATQAYRSARPARLGLAIADGTGVGTNRRDPAGPADPQTPVLIVQTADGCENIAAMIVCSMHPTVLHEDSTLISGDFPAMTRNYLQQNVLGRDCPVIYHTGPAGNQSPRHVTKANTFAEAQRLGELLGKAIQEAIPQMEFTSSPAVQCRQDFVDLPRRSFPSVEVTQTTLGNAVERLESLRNGAATREEVRTAECDWFGAEEMLTLAKAAADGRIEAAFESCMPAEVQVIKLGKWAFASWPGEVFVEYSLAVKAESDEAFVISLANGELQGYIVTAQAATEGGYEASNALFAPASGQVFVDATLRLLGSLE